MFKNRLKQIISSKELDDVKEQCINNIKNEIGDIKEIFQQIQHEFILNNDYTKEFILDIIDSYYYLSDIIHDIMDENEIDDDKYNEIYNYVITNSKEINLLITHAQEMTSNINIFNQIVQQHNSTKTSYKSAHEVVEKLYELKLGYCYVN